MKLSRKKSQIDCWQIVLLEWALRWEYFPFEPIPGGYFVHPINIQFELPRHSFPPVIQCFSIVLPILD